MTSGALYKRENYYKNIFTLYLPIFVYFTVKPFASSLPRFHFALFKKFIFNRGWKHINKRQYRKNNVCNIFKYNTKRVELCHKLITIWLNAAPVNQNSSNNSRSHNTNLHTNSRMSEHFIRNYMFMCVQVMTSWKSTNSHWWKSIFMLDENHRARKQLFDLQ